MAELNDWSTTAASNNSAPPNGWPENMAYSAVNNSAREGMAVLKRYFADVNGSLAAAGSANAYTLTLNAGYAAYFEGMYFACSIPATNTGASTINVNAISAQNIVNRDGSALAAGQLTQNGLYEFRYDGTNFQLMGTLAGGTLVVDGVSLTTDINTATPPTTEAVTGAYAIYDGAGNDLLAELGYSASNNLRVHNQMHGGNVLLIGQNASGTNVTVLDADPDDVQVTVPLNNDAANPTIAFGDGDTGFYESADDSLQIATAGVVRYLIDATLLGVNSSSGAALLNETPSASNPTVVPARNDSDTGMGRSTTNELSLVVGGVEGIRVRDGTASDRAAYAAVRGPDGNLYDVGYNVIPTDSSLDTGNATAIQGQIGHEYSYTSGTARTLNLTNNAAIPVDAVWAYYVGPSAGTLTAQAGTGVTITYWDGATWQVTGAAGSITVGKGQGTIKKLTDTSYRISGPNLS